MRLMMYSLPIDRYTLGDIQFLECLGKYLVKMLPYLDSYPKTLGGPSNRTATSLRQMMDQVRYNDVRDFVQNLNFRFFINPN